MSILKRRERPLKKDLTERKLKATAKLSYREVVDKYKIAFSSETKEPLGLSQAQAAKRLEKFGENAITLGKHQTTATRAFEAAVNPFNGVLIIIILVSYFASRFAGESSDWVAIGIIFAMVVISSVVSFVQSQRSHDAAAKLASMITNTATVYRDGEAKEVPMHDLVPGDVVKLAAGDMIPGDVRFLTTKHIFVAQAALTGESVPVEKKAGAQISDKDSLTDMRNLAFMGTNVVSGFATAVVLETGNDTYFGSMAKTLNNNKGKNAFERGVASVSRLLIQMMVVMVPLVFVINGLLKADWSMSLLFAISVAVGLTPEMLPVIMTSTLALGAVGMSKHKVIVKNLGAIQTFGEMDILCTDKTGTLTEDKIILEKYLDLNGDDSEAVLQAAYLNSAFQTGLKGLLDLAVIARAEKNGLNPKLTEYERLGEVPFDFMRRRLSVVLKTKAGKRFLVTKGAVEEMLSISKLTKAQLATANKTYEKYNQKGFRVLAVAIRELPKDEDSRFDPSDERDMEFAGFIGFFDPPKDSAVQAVAGLKAHGVRTIVLTGDSLGVAKNVCEKVGIDTKHTLSGADVDKLDDEGLKNAAAECELFVKLSPAQKARLVKAIQDAGHTVGYLGDGINDAPPLHQADIGISVDNAVDIAKETANIILLKKDLTVLDEGVMEGRRTFGNVSKYIKMTVSGNFGNMISVLVASAVLPFLPMLPIQILTQNLLYDVSQLGIPFDNVDEDYIKKPRKWDPKSIRRFMFFIGPISSIFDIAAFAVLWFVFGWHTEATTSLFWAGWFVVGTTTQALIMLIARTNKTNLFKTPPAKPLLLATLSVIALAIIIAFSPIAEALQMTHLPPIFALPLVLILLAYIGAVQLAKVFYQRVFKSWL
ncbi:magnesium-translocating P-type ATPase [Candidatus Saccharibacteria bacterium]|nr:magnesium-translocating P-type ATPase [Candidatus Saccharibacteria bacterium]